MYADIDPVVHAHAKALLTGTGTTKIILADLRDPAAIIREASGFLDFTRPVALLLVAILHFIPDTEDPAAIVAALRDALPPGSYLAMSHGTTDFHPAEVTSTAAAAYDTATAPLVLRSRPAIEPFSAASPPSRPAWCRPPSGVSTSAPSRRTSRRSACTPVSRVRAGCGCGWRRLPRAG